MPPKRFYVVVKASVPCDVMPFSVSLIGATQKREMPKMDLQGLNY
jgi:hypothetical protein